ncbi:bifunctional 4-hydroxy-2-oxoglutarate aldolase/2-dehydro-3-deoxy-phosphogluconate aldolase [Ornithinimicrobium cryptoxanthini]|uniref:bifunctional 4-hydroxy-2-oxoglutarate aldolase/2-dehydro-3-deoxy-phosphogluconate aldolase n=1 Tax=Ornithinimicrobium cryptoxanthini TaxID=2934161 RepID=UPI002117AA4A|nr:bifunctional 4-hydroxy-2-oxoglutarate aldolase/2-dehydro-3-deoxy-phosphogluconate aldolase [Ornithinimicrobium cryptoxanthini]
MKTADLLALSPVIPVVVIEDVEHAVPLARALARGGVGVIEVTLRTEAGLEALRRIAAEVPDVVVGAGTVTAPEQTTLCEQAGARFLVTPGASPRVLDAALDTGLPLLPGAATLTEMMTLLEHGLPEMKFFPALPAGGTAYLSAVLGPLPQVRFCPTGGITADNARQFLALPNVACVGGSWLTPKEALLAQDWDRVTQLAAEASTLLV